MTKIFFAFLLLVQSAHAVDLFAIASGEPDEAKRDPRWKKCVAFRTHNDVTPPTHSGASPLKSDGTEESCVQACSKSYKESLDLYDNKVPMSARCYFEGSKVIATYGKGPFVFLYPKGYIPY